MKTNQINKIHINYIKYFNLRKMLENIPNNKVISNNHKLI
jgi:hypothetical protein